MIFVFLSHDVDWGKEGAPIAHIMARKERFDEEVLRKCASENPYYNFPEYMEIEERFGVRSTFFFRTYVSGAPFPPPSYHVEEYNHEIKSLVKGGWEIGLHMDPSSHSKCGVMKKEKEALEDIADVPVYGNRVHYTMNNDVLYRNLQKVGFKYDSSAKFSRERIVKRDFGYFKKSRLIVFPMTIMDTLAFTYLAVGEEDVVKLIKKVLGICDKLQRKDKVITILWHDCVLKMRKGRLYPEVLEYLTSRKDIEIKRGIDLVNMIEEGSL
jgi:peptidoglycan/xylan/chitin deacetylase (PgdA/CDA1 family)